MIALELFFCSLIVTCFWVKEVFVEITCAKLVLLLVGSAMFFN